MDKLVNGALWLLASSIALLTWLFIIADILIWLEWRDEERRTRR